MMNTEIWVIMTKWNVNGDECNMYIHMGTMGMICEITMGMISVQHVNDRYVTNDNKTIRTK